MDTGYQKDTFVMINRCRDLGRRLLHIPLFYKVLLTNAVSVVLIVVATSLAIRYVSALFSGPRYDLIALLALAGLLVSCAVNSLVMKLALAPLDRLEAAMDDVRHGKLSVQIETGPVSDERFDRLIAAFRQMLTTLQKNNQQLHHVSQKILVAQEQERQRVARELHDESAQTLTSLLLYLKLLAKSQNPEEAQRIQNLRQLAAHALEEIRRVAMELHPRILDDWGLEAALGRRVDELNSTNCIQVAFSVDGCVPGRLPKDLELAFYRVAQEALNNIVRHSHAQRAHVTLACIADCLTLEIQDDGIGFNTAIIGAARSNGLGLMGMRERLALVGGDLTIESHIGNGTQITAQAPLVHRSTE